MSCRKRTKRSRRENKRQPQPKQRRVRNDTLFREVLDWFVPQGELFAKDEFHGNVKWECITGFVMELGWVRMPTWNWLIWFAASSRKDMAWL